MFRVERVGINSPLNVVISSDGISEIYSLPTPRSAICDPLGHEQKAGLLTHPSPWLSEFANVRKALVKIAYLPSHHVEIKLSAFRWWGSWYEDLLPEVEMDEVGSYPNPDYEWSPESTINFTTLTFENRRLSPLRVLELAIGTQYWYTFEVPQLRNSLSPINPHIYEPWKGDQWVPYLLSSDSSQHLFRKLIEFLSDDGA